MYSMTATTTSGNDGTDYKHRQKVAALIKQSVRYKFNLKLLFALHSVLLLLMWAKVGGEIVYDRLELLEKPEFWTKLDLPAASAWEYVWSLSFIPMIITLLSFPKNKLLLLKLSVVADFIFQIVPYSVCFGYLIAALLKYLLADELVTIGGNFPMVILWCLFFLAVILIHGFTMHFKYKLNAAWQRDPTQLKQADKMAQKKTDRFHFLIMLPLWAKVGGEILFNECALVGQPAFWAKLDLPAANPWEYVWSRLSFIPIIFALPSFPKNKAATVLIFLLFIGCFELPTVSAHFASPDPIEHNTTNQVKAALEIFGLKMQLNMEKMKTELKDEIGKQRKEAVDELRSETKWFVNWGTIAIAATLGTFASVIFYLYKTLKECEQICTRLEAINQHGQNGGQQ